MQRTERVRSYQAGDELTTITKTLTQEKINRYADASGDRNPLHIDPAFAAGTQFGGTIAHGMLVLAYVSELMTAEFGGAWPSSGRVLRIEDGRTSCEVECRNQTGEVLISGEASLRTL